MYLIKRNKRDVLGDYRSGVSRHELVRWPARLHGFGEPQAPRDVVGGFAFDKADLSPAQQAKIADLALDVLVRVWPGGRVRLVGHTDPVGSPQYNKALGQRRADNVRQALIAALESRNPGSSRSVTITVDSAGETQPVPGEAPAAQRRVEVFLVAPSPPSPPPPPPPSPPPPPQWVPPPGYREPPRMGPARPGVVYPREECPEYDICETTRKYLLDLQRKKTFLSQEDVDRALNMEHALLRRHRQAPRIVDPREGPKLAKWVMEMRLEAYKRLKKFASQVSWMPFPRL